MSRSTSIALARELGIENPEAYSAKELNFQISVRKDILDLY
jgi:hypothetical protein